MLSFITALQSLLFSAELFGTVNLLGVESTNWFVYRNWWVIDVPLVCCMCSIGLMLVSAMVSVGGLVTKWVYYTILVIGIASFLCFACVFFRLQKDMYGKRKQLYRLAQRIHISKLYELIITLLLIAIIQYIYIFWNFTQYLAKNNQQYSLE